MSETDVLIVGAGPTGLALALFLQRAGVKPRIVDKNSGPGQASRAMAVQARTLEFYRQLGFADEVVSKGIKIEAMNVRAHGHRVAEIRIGDVGEGLSPYPFILSFPQDDHERLLVEKLKDVGVDVEWSTELVSVHASADNVAMELRHPDGAAESVSAAWVCGCDGSHSLARQSLKLDFAGATYEKVFFVADVEATGEAAANRNFNLCLTGDDLVIVLPVRSTGMNRLIGIIPETFNGRNDLTFEDLRSYVEKAADIHVGAVNWFSTYKVHHRVAEHFRVGRVFIAGDAGHVHSPVGGQGMNTGIGDAVNLAWKLAAVVQGKADAAILDTYEPERIAFARSLVSTTDKVFQLVTGSGSGSHLFRETLLPHLAPFAFGFSAVRTSAFRLVSQTRISYHASALSQGTTGELHGGDRLPWVPRGDIGTDNFIPLQSLQWQIHIYGQAGQAIRDAATTANIALHEFPWSIDAEHVGLKRDALYLIRPDGYIALADAEQDVAKLQDYLAKLRIVMR